MGRLALFALCLLACRHEEEPRPRTRHYQLRFESLRDEGGRKEWYPDGTLDGAVLLVDGVEQARVDEGGYASASVQVGRTFHDGRRSMALRLPTPCGPREVTLKYTTTATPADEEGPKFQNPNIPFEPKVTIRRDPSMLLPASTMVNVDDESAPMAVVKLGSLQIRRRRLRNHREGKGREERLWDLGCATEHAVTIDGSKVGVVRAADPGALGFLISTDPKACYQQRILVYSDSAMPVGGAAKRFPLLRGQVNPTGWDGIHFFLEPPASAVDGSGTTGRGSLQRVPCP